MKFSPNMNILWLIYQEIHMHLQHMMNSTEKKFMSFLFQLSQNLLIPVLN
jgi:hypothetical protein